MARQNGMTLIEVALAIAIVSIALVPTANMWLASAQATASAGQRSRASALAQRILESSVRDVSYDQQVATSGIDVDSGLRYALTLAPATLAPPLKTSTLRRATVTVTTTNDPQPLVELVSLTAKEAP
ncbi:MAG TPA: prepilin-type N-terminal cleavage/methylation domain-containing protein [Stenomitos sp.]